MEIANWGAGAVGIGLASALAAKGSAIRIVGRDSETFDAFERLGIHRSGLFSERPIPPEARNDLVNSR